MKIRKEISSDRKIAIITGILFIIATVAGILGSSITGAIIDAPDYLIQISANQNRILIGSLLQFIAAATSVAIAITLYPILRRYNEGLSFGAVSFRLIEGLCYIISALGLLSLLSLSKEFVSAGAPTDSYFQVLGDLLLAVRNYAGFVFGVIAFCIGALMYYYVFYRSKLIPRWLSGWGIVALALLIVLALLVMFGREPSGMILILAAPLGAQEMVLAIWLIIKGFNATDKSTK